MISPIQLLKTLVKPCFRFFFFVILWLKRIDQPAKANEPKRPRDCCNLRDENPRKHCGRARERVVIQEGRLTGWVGNLWCRNAGEVSGTKTRVSTRYTGGEIVSFQSAYGSWHHYPRLNYRARVCVYVCVSTLDQGVSIRLEWNIKFTTIVWKPPPPKDISKIFTNLLHKSSNSNLNDLVSIIFYERIFHGDIDILIEYDNLKVNLKVFIIDKLLRNSSRGIGNLIYFLIYLSCTKRFESRSKCSSILLLSNNLLSNQYPVSNIPYWDQEREKRDSREETTLSIRDISTRRERQRERRTSSLPSITSRYLQTFEGVLRFVVCRCRIEYIGNDIASTGSHVHGGM